MQPEESIMSQLHVQQAKEEAHREFRTRRKTSTWIKKWYIQDQIAIRRGFRSWDEYLKHLRKLENAQ
jgi:hypothetical protein